MNFQATINGQEIGYSLVKLFPVGPDINGQWFNLGHAGEGFYLTEDSGRLIGAYFTHQGEGFPTWFTFDCQKSGEIYTGPVYLTQGGTMAVPHDPLESVVVGTITFTLGAEPDPEPDPEPEPEPPPEPEPEPEPPDVVVEHKLGNTWHPLNVPVVGTIQGITTTQIRNKHLVREYRITSDEPLSLSQSTFLYDPAYNLNPSIQISGNNVRLYLGPSNSSFPSLTKHAGFKVQDATHGVLIEVSAQVAGA